jgi:hypothetical protein
MVPSTVKLALPASFIWLLRLADRDWNIAIPARAPEVGALMFSVPPLVWLSVEFASKNQVIPVPVMFWPLLMFSVAP